VRIIQCLGGDTGRQQQQQQHGRLKEYEHVQSTQAPGMLQEAVPQVGREMEWWSWAAKQPPR
jgi:hypothetical protein